jgi:hypothetical protein
MRARINRVNPVFVGHWAGIRVACRRYPQALLTRPYPPIAGWGVRHFPWTIGAKPVGPVPSSVFSDGAPRWQGRPSTLYVLPGLARSPEHTRCARRNCLGSICRCPLHRPGFSPGYWPRCPTTYRAPTLDVPGRSYNRTDPGINRVNSIAAYPDTKLQIPCKSYNITAQRVLSTTQMCILNRC